MLYTDKSVSIKFISILKLSFIVLKKEIQAMNFYPTAIKKPLYYSLTNFNYEDGNVLSKEFLSYSYRII